MTTADSPYPTRLHAAAAATAVAFFAPLAEVDTVLLVNSCARGQGTAESDLDIVVISAADLPSEKIGEMEAAWVKFRNRDEATGAFLASGRFTKIHLDVVNGRYEPTVWDDGGGPDGFELEVGNHVAYSRPLTAVGQRFAALQARWLPYYAAELRAERLKMVHDACLYDLEFVPFMVARELYFQAFDRLYKAEQEFLQFLFIAERRYPLAYNKWIFKQLVGDLGLQDVYEELAAVLSVEVLNGPALRDRAARLRRLVEECEARP